MNKNDCYSCGGLVLSRKPSRSGASFCRKPDCQNAKARFFRKRWKDGITIEVDGSVARHFISVAMHQPRHACPVCGLLDAVGPYIHRDVRNPLKSCYGTGGVGPREGLSGVWCDIVHPELKERAIVLQAAEEERQAEEARRQAEQAEDA